MNDHHGHGHDNDRHAHPDHGGHGLDENTGHGDRGHDAHAGHSVEAFRSKFWLSLILTVPVFRVVELAVAEGMSEGALRIAAAVETESGHPIARGIVASAEDREIEIPAADGFRSITGKGVAASVDATEYHMGGPALLEAESAAVPDALRAAAERAAHRGQAAIYLLRAIRRWPSLPWRTPSARRAGRRSRRCTSAGSKWPC